MSNIIKLQDKQYLAGARIWSHWLGVGNIPQFQLYEFSGHQESTGLYFFHMYKNPSKLIGRSMSQLITMGNFRPFCLDSAESIKYIQDIVNQLQGAP